MIMRGILGFAVVITFITWQAGAQPPVSSWSGPTPGAYAVGFQRAFIVDSTRSFITDDGSSGMYRGRPIRLYIWYPARDASSGDRMVFGDYVDTQAPEDFGQYNGLLTDHDQRAASGQFQPRTDSLLQKLLDSPTLARHDATIADGRFPLILHSTGLNGWQAEATVLNEYLASHGYVVVNVPQLGPRIEQANVPYSPLGADLQRNDIEVALAHIINKPYIDQSRIAAMGHSFGGLVAVWLASRNSNIDAVAALDGSHLIPRGVEVFDGIDWEPDAVQIPVLSIYTLGQGERDLSVARGLRYADRYFLNYPNASHFDFQNWPLHVARWSPEDSRAQRLRAHEEGQAMYLATIQFTRLFFDATLKGDTSAMRFVKGEERLSGIPAGALLSYEEAAGASLAMIAQDSFPQLLLPRIVNTLADEYGPTYTPDGRSLYFVRRLNRQGNESIYVTHETAEGWSNPVTASFSGVYYDKEPFLSPDGERMFFASTRPGGGEDGFDIWMSDWNGDSWKEPMKLGPEVNTEGVYDNYPSVATNGNLYFGSRREGSDGIDLWMARFQDGVYRQAQNVGSIINSSATEADPYIDPNERFIIFCSTREGGEGSCDLYVSYADGAGGWQAPVNLGPQINTADFEYTPLISPDGEWFLFSRGWGEIYRIRAAEVAALNP